MTHTNNSVGQGPLWRRMAARLRAFGEAMEMSEAEFQSRRMDALDQRLRELTQNLKVSKQPEPTTATELE